MNSTIITPDGTSQTLDFTSVSTSSGVTIVGLMQAVYPVPNLLGTYQITIYAYNGTTMVETWGSFSAVSSDTASLQGLTSISSSNSQAISDLQGNLTADNKATQSSLSSLGSQVTSGTNAVEGSLQSLGNSVGSAISSSGSSIQNSISALSSQVSTGNTNIQNSLSGISSKLDSTSTSASNAETYALGALIVALLAVLVAAYGAMRKG
ncbi:MAG TPA: hypothetical protein VEJ36_02345 [Nitrososphaerales archaeon]|nr:hypothetical protein [Nitrososphaerales archaeon]